MWGQVRLRLFLNESGQAGLECSAGIGVVVLEWGSAESLARLYVQMCVSVCAVSVRAVSVRGSCRCARVISCYRACLTAASTHACHGEIR